MNKLTIIPIIAILVLLLTVSFASAVSPDPEEAICYWPLEKKPILQEWLYTY